MVYIETGLSEPKYLAERPQEISPSKKDFGSLRIDFETGRVHIKEKFLPFLIAAKDRSLQVGRLEIGVATTQRWCRHRTL